MCFAAHGVLCGDSGSCGSQSLISVEKKKGQKPVLVDSASFCYSWNGTNG